MTSPDSVRPATWLHVPNALSLARIVCAPLLVLMAAAAGADSTAAAWVANVLG